MRPYLTLRCTHVAPVASVLITVVWSIACAGDAPRVGESKDTVGGGARVTIDSSAGTTELSGKVAMQGMDHSRMTMPPAATPAVPTAPPAKDAMRGMDHSKMAMPPVAPARGTMPAMDHSKMGRPAARTDTTAMDHARMSGAARSQQPSATPARRMTDIPGMVHAPETSLLQNKPADDSSMMKLQRLLARLVTDSVVRSRILADSFLRNRWQDSVVRRLLLPRP